MDMVSSPLVIFVVSGTSSFTLLLVRLFNYFLKVRNIKERGIMDGPTMCILSLYFSSGHKTMSSFILMELDMRDQPGK